ncbi:hypothetical protein LPH50_04330 [Xylella taiwanensis]|uniref:Uncharacterized protein n=1 Tax=Xylella taiwanensis TaxID=1444770 RepID=A0ABS8TT06_9GAMM|nr:hypothetical protein [Xylella taiwanensis]MCD8457456.1 hypothetical protein [Xylella taiwanensis]MCD8457614.1 hypothetical protein [Xylella taiwanensis]MCD8461261.1 hypothetical protein [Xylella taiwanensis]MCD8462704.1 hypothetical protein [Xylella taiwanensis]MCD8466490.1 hypothetical protein [Xylella taiwanensis]
MLLVGVVITLPYRQALAGTQVKQQLSTSIQAGPSASLSDNATPKAIFPCVAGKIAWLTDKAALLHKRLADVQDHIAFRNTVYYEATRTGFDSELVFSVI